MNKTTLCILLASGSVLTTSSGAAEPGAAPASSDPLFEQPETFVPKPAMIPQAGNSWLAVAGDEGASASRPTGIWQGEVGDGFRSGVQTLSLEAGGSQGVKAFGGRRAHDLALSSVSYGYMLGNVMSKDHWYRGNWEIRAELFGGAEVSPTRDWLVGLTPHLRYNFATGTRWVPFIDGGAGVSGTGIGHPDLSDTFEFNLQENAGVHWFVQDNLAFNFEVGFLHMSNAGMHDPNQGLNTIKGMVGLTWFF
jgi:hypothetical protein